MQECEWGHSGWALHAETVYVLHDQLQDVHLNPYQHRPPELVRLQCQQDVLVLIANVSLRNNMRFDALQVADIQLIRMLRWINDVITTPDQGMRHRHLVVLRCSSFLLFYTNFKRNAFDMFGRIKHQL